MLGADRSSPMTSLGASCLRLVGVLPLLLLLGTACTLENRDAPTAGASAPPPTMAPKTWSWERKINPDPVLLFRYSALTFNGHRIHYDRRYVTEVEGYPGLVVHGPLIATLLLDLLHREMPDADVSRFQFKAIRPLFDLEAFSVYGRTGEGNTVQLWARDHEGWLAMEATAVLR